MEEASLVARAQAGDRESFGLLVRMHQGRLRGLVALAVAGHDDVHDIVQESFIDAWRGLDGFTAGRPFGPWLRTICRHRVHRFLRDRMPQRRRELALVDAALATAPADDGAAEAAEARIALLRRCLADLDETQRRLLARRYQEDEPVQAIAASLGRSPNAVSMLLLRLKMALMRCVAQRQVPGTA